MLSATNADLHTECAAGRFREDLLFRLNTVEISLPPLRDRREDIPALAGHFMARYAERYRRTIQGLEAGCPPDDVAVWLARQCARARPHH